MDPYTEYGSGPEYGPNLDPDPQLCLLTKDLHVLVQGVPSFLQPVLQHAAEPRAHRGVCGALLLSSLEPTALSL